LLTANKNRKHNESNSIPARSKQQEPR